MYQLILRFNRWYDQLGEPWRLLSLMAAALIALVPMNLGMTYHHPLIYIFGLVWFSFLLLVGAGRAYSFGGWHRYGGAVLMVLSAAHLAAAACFLYWMV